MRDGSDESQRLAKGIVSPKECEVSILVEREGLCWNCGSLLTEKGITCRPCRRGLTLGHKLRGGRALAVHDLFGELVLVDRLFEKLEKIPAAELRRRIRAARTRKEVA